MLRGYIQRHKDWSLKTFGEGRRTEGLCKHIEKELQEVRQNPDDVFEWVDIIILAIDGAWRSGHSPLQVVNALIEKQAINFGRTWEESGSEDEPVEHKR